MLVIIKKGLPDHIKLLFLFVVCMTPLLLVMSNIFLSLLGDVEILLYLIVAFSFFNFIVYTFWGYLVFMYFVDNSNVGRLFVRAIISFPSFFTKLCFWLGKMFLLFLLLFIPGVNYLVRTVWVVPLIILKGSSFVEAEKESKSLTKNRYRETFGLLMYVFGIAFLYSILFYLLVFFELGIEYLFPPSIGDYIYVFLVILMLFSCIYFFVRFFVKFVFRVLYQYEMNDIRVYKSYLFKFSVWVSATLVISSFCFIVFQIISPDIVRNPSLYYVFYKHSFNKAEEYILSGKEGPYFIHGKRLDENVSSGGNYWYAIVGGFLENEDDLVFSKDGVPPPITFNGCRVSRYITTIRISDHRFLFRCS